MAFNTYGTDLTLLKESRGLPISFGTLKPCNGFAQPVRALIPRPSRRH